MDKEYHDKYCELGWNKNAKICHCVARLERFNKDAEYRRGFSDGASSVGHYIKTQGLRHIKEKISLNRKYREKLHAENHKAFTKGWEKGQLHMEEKPPEADDNLIKEKIKKEI